MPSRYDEGFDGDWRRYVSMAERRRKGARAQAALRRSGREVAPVEIVGRRITQTFWGDAWCRNLEAYSDYANRLPRGRTYVRNGSVIDLRIDAGRVRSLVSGSEIYETEVRITPLPKARWRKLRSRCAGQIDSLVELLRGSLSGPVMEIVTAKSTGLFPSPKEISLECSCPDWASLCKHLAATLYGVGARLDVAIREGTGASTCGRGRGRGQNRRLAGSTADLSSVFGIDLDGDGDAAGARGRKRARRAPTKGTKTRKAARKKAKATRTKATKVATTRTKKAAAKKKATKKTAAKKQAARAGRAEKRQSKRPLRPR